MSCCDPAIANFLQLLLSTLLPGPLNEHDLVDFFGTYGEIEGAEVLRGRDNNQPRGFGFVIFHSEIVVQALVAKRFFEVASRSVEVKACESQPAARARTAEVQRQAQQRATAQLKQVEQQHADSKKGRGGGGHGGMAAAPRREPSQQPVNQAPGHGSLSPTHREMLPSHAAPSMLSVQDEANRYLAGVYTGARTCMAVVGMMRKFGGSADARERQLFQCVQRTVLDRRSSFPAMSDKELHQTSVLIGALVQYDVLEKVYMATALGCVLEAVQQPLDSKMFCFGVTALKQFRRRLSMWGEYCVALLRLPHLLDDHPVAAELKQIVNAAMQQSSAAQYPASVNSPLGGLMGSLFPRDVAMTYLRAFEEADVGLQELPALSEQVASLCGTCCCVYTLRSVADIAASAGLRLAWYHTGRCQPDPRCFRLGMRRD